MIVTSITDGISHGDGHCSLIFRPIDDENNEIEFNSIFVDWSKDSNPRIAELEMIASGITQLNDTIFTLGRLGQIACISNDVLTQEKIVGPDDYGFLTDIKVIENTIFTVGMCRQVYIRKNSEIWDRFDKGVLDEAMNVDRVTGFRAIDGITIDNMVAVGFDGEIWHYQNGIWREIQSPTNVTIEQVKAIAPNGFYAVGQAGVILHGSGDQWEIIDQIATEDDFWGIEWFNDRLYLNTSSDIYQLDSNNELEIVSPTDNGPQYFSRLRASQDALWSFGPERAFWTTDGTIWNEAKIFGYGSDLG